MLGWGPGPSLLSEPLQSSLGPGVACPARGGTESHGPEGTVNPNATDEVLIRNEASSGRGPLRGSKPCEVRGERGQLVQPPDGLPARPATA